MTKFGSKIITASLFVMWALLPGLLTAQSPRAERVKLEIRGEFFNAYNFANFANPNANVLAPGTLGRITQSSAGPRVIQFAAKFSF